MKDLDKEKMAAAAKALYGDLAEFQKKNGYSDDDIRVLAALVQNATCKMSGYGPLGFEGTKDQLLKAAGVKTMPILPGHITRERLGRRGCVFYLPMKYENIIEWLKRYPL